MIDKRDKLPVTRQCALLDLSRSGIYYTPVALSVKDRELMRQIDEIHLAYPFYGSRKIRNELWAKGYDLGRDRVRRLMRRMVLAWRLSNTLDGSFCVDALEEAITKYGCPEIFNTDQGSQFTAETFADTLRSRGISISMDGKGRWMDNVFIERLWKSVKYEDIYLKAYGSMTEVKKGLPPISCSTTKDDGTKTLTGRPRLWFSSTPNRRDRLRHEHDPRAVSH